MDDFYEDDVFDDLYDDGPYHDEAFYIDPDDDVYGLLFGDAAFRDPQVRAAHRYHEGPAWSTVETILARLLAFVSMSPLAATRAWLGFEFGAGEMYGLDEELALCAAVRRDPGVTLSEDALFEIFDAALRSGDHDDDARLDAQAAEMLDRLRTLSTRR